VDARGDVAVILREGSVTREELAVPVHDGTGASLAASPGTRHAHYRPACRVELAAPGRAAARASALAAGGTRVGLVATEAAPDPVVEIARFRDTEELAAGLYAWLRAAEEAVDVLVVEEVAPHGLGRAVMDRLRRAAGA